MVTWVRARQRSGENRWSPLRGICMNRRRPNGLNWIQIRKTIAWSLISSLVHMGGISISPQRAWAEETVQELEARLNEAHKALNDPNTPTQYMPSYAATVNDLNKKLAAKKSESQGKPQPRTGVPQQMPFKSDTGSSPSLAGNESGGAGADPTASSSDPSESSAPSSGGSMGSAPGSMGTGYVRTQERARARANDNCEYSATHNAGWGCDLTDGLATTAKVTGQVSQVAGAALVTMGGQQDLSGASSGSQADAFKAAQKSAKRTADIEAGVGAVNAAMGLGLIIQGMAHSGHAKAAKKIGNADVTIDPSGQATASGEGKRAIQAFRMNEAGQLTSTDQAALNAKKSHVTGMLDEVSGHIASEQAGASKKAMAQGVSSLVTGAQQLIMSAAHRNMANN
ncbi:hypothetical protein EBZ37_05530, partial [bacterium]|nr:hypothetical protein [bacterium]